MEHRVVYTRPYDSEVEYLESTRTQYIDTGIIHNLSDTIETRIQFTKSFNIRQRAFGAWESGKSCMIQYYESRIDFTIGDTIIAHIQGDTDVHDYLYDGITRKGYIDNVTDNNIANKTSNNTSLGIFFQNRDEIIYDFSHARIYYFRIKRNGNYILNLIPVRVGSVGYMYDRVSGKLFGNKGTNNFILGQDVANSVPKIRRVFRFGNKRFVIPMPYDSKIEYLETDGTQYINLGLLTLPVHTKIEYKAKCSTLQTDNGKIVSYGKVRTKDNFSIWEQKTKMFPSMLGKETQINTGTTLVHTVIMERLNTTKGVFSINDNSTNISGSCTTSENYLYLFADNGMNNYLGRLYYLKVITNNTLIIDLIPVRRGNIGYLYDKISGKLFGNSGTGQFILGNDIND